MKNYRSILIASFQSRGRDLLIGKHIEVSDAEKDRSFSPVVGIY